MYPPPLLPPPRPSAPPQGQLRVFAEQLSGGAPHEAAACLDAAARLDQLGAHGSGPGLGSGSGVGSGSGLGSGSGDLVEQQQQQQQAGHGVQVGVRGVCVVGGG